MAKQGFFDEHWKRVEEEPAGVASGTGWTILWDPRLKTKTTFATAAHAVHAVIDRIKFYQGSKFACEENQAAIQHLQIAEELLSDAGNVKWDECRRAHWVDKDDNPAGGFFQSDGILISWQNGPLGEVGTADRKDPNGAFVEDVIDAIGSFIKHIRSYFKNPEVVTVVLMQLMNANEILDARTKRRVMAKTEGTHEGN